MYHFSIVKSGHDEAEEKGAYGDDPAEENMIDNYEYVMYGKIFNYKPAEKDKAEVQVSFGGLLLSLTGLEKHLKQLKNGSRIYMMMKKA